MPKKSLDPAAFANQWEALDKFRRIVESEKPESANDDSRWEALDKFRGIVEREKPELIKIDVMKKLVDHNDLQVGQTKGLVKVVVDADALVVLADPQHRHHKRAKIIIENIIKYEI